ncbi:glycosyl hydrolase family 8 [Ornithinibacillus salinisoli]|uniref:Glycosyl hydrolase family 8 n=1 Tax=Ornithinibacillus salinisoli TaxID=1848459 RepID=A0ABW4W053_9BACI
MRKLTSIISVLIIVIVAVIVVHFNKENSLATEKFIKKWLINDNGTLATYVRDDHELDEDLVQGRESLSETLGLWMLYALEKDDEQHFDQAFNMLIDFFLEKDGFIHWKLLASGESEVHTNALVDDLRIIDALIQAHERWNHHHYEEVAKLISHYVNKFSEKSGILTDFYERKHQYSSDVVTLPYIDPGAMEKMVHRGWLNQESFGQTILILENAPLENGFYPKRYQVTEKNYQFDNEINMVDQALVAYHLAKLDIESNELIQFAVQQYSQFGAIFGKYDIHSKEPAVTYESPAVYGLLMLYCLEVGELSMAENLYERMIVFRNDNKLGSYYGGYSVSESGDTHIFDNLVPLLAEKRLRNMQAE